MASYKIELFDVLYPYNGKLPQLEREEHWFQQQQRALMEPMAHNQY